MDNIGILESEGSPKYQKISIIFLGFSAAKLPYGTGLFPACILLCLIFVLLQASLAQGVDKAFLVCLLKIIITVLSDIVQGEFGIYSKNLYGCPPFHPAPEAFVSPLRRRLSTCTWTSPS